jgi:TPR repeat protein
MKRILASLLIGLSLIAGTAAGARAQDFDKGLRAYKSGDYAAALKEWSPLAKQGDKTSQYNLGIMFYKGHGVVRDFKEALYWFHKAADQDDATARFWLGLMHHNGEGVPQNLFRAIRWYELAAAQGDKFAQHALGKLYRDGQGLQKDEKLAFKWIELAAEQGLADAQSDLAELYGKAGTAKPEDIKTALKWAKRAAANGHSKAIDQLERAKDELIEIALADCLFENIEKVTGPETKTIVENYCRQQLQKKSIDWLMKYFPYAQ